MLKKYQLSEFSTFTDGDYSFDFPAGFAVRLINFELLSETSKIFVCFSGAVSNREIKTAPFFSGSGMATSLKLPSIIISDYVVTNNKSLGLAWYAGDYTGSTFQKLIADFLDRVSFKFGKSLILLGGSGGGFACLAIASMLKTECTVVSMNPQTSISKYFSNPVNSYLCAAFPDSKDLVSKNCEEFLNRKGILNNVCNINYPDNIKIIYLQNKKDHHHIVNHLSFFLQNKDFFPIGDNSFIYNKNIGLYLGDWGDGHIPPQKNIIEKIIKHIVEKDEIPYVLRELENGLSGSNLNINDFTLLTKYDHQLVARSKIVNNILTTNISLIYRGSEISIPDGIKYAVYLLDKNNNVIEKKPYANKVLDIDYYSDISRLKIFAKDKCGMKITTLTNRI